MAKDNLPDLIADAQRLAAEAAALTEVVESSSTEIATVGSIPAEAVKAQMQDAAKQARTKRAELAKANERVREATRRQMDELQARVNREMADAQAMLAPLMEQVERLQEGIWTVTLYLGTNEQIVRLAEGKPADPDTPITVRQQVLAMDEEVAAFPDDDGIDAANIETFDEWLMAKPEHLEQVLPEPRGIVVLQPRLTRKGYRDPWTQEAMDKANAHSYWLIRNGENVYRMDTEFDVGKTVIPKADEFTSLFRGKVWDHKTHEYVVRDLEPGSDEWMKAEKAQGARERHYMRAALVLQGLVDRTAVFQPMNAPVTFLQSHDYETGRVRLITDAEKALTTAREPFYDWLARLNAELRPGMRIIGHFSGEDWQDTRYEHSHGNSRLSPPGAETPPSYVIHRLDEWRNLGHARGLVFKYKRTEQVWTDKWIEDPNRPGWGHYGGMVTPKRRASAVVLPTDRSIIPFDLVTVEEMQTYMDARTERHAYRHMFPLLRAAITAKRDEQEAERPFREALVPYLQGAGADYTEAAAEVESLVRWWKLTNKFHRPLVSENPADEAKAIEAIVAEYTRRTKADKGTVERDEAAVRWFREQSDDIMFVGRKRDGSYVAWAPMQRRWTERAGRRDMWVAEWTLSKTGRTTAREWVLINNRHARLDSLYEGERWAKWDKVAHRNSDLTDPEIETLATQVGDWFVERLATGNVARIKSYSQEPVKALLWAVDHKGKAGRFDVYAVPAEQAPLPPVHLGDEDGDRWHRGDGIKGVRYLSASLNWSRKPSGEVEIKYPEIGSHEREIDRYGRYGDWPWSTNNVGDHTDYAVLHNLDVDDIVAERKAEVKARLDEQKAALGMLHSTAAAVEQEWSRQEEERQHAKFIEDYDDEELWPEHRKTLRLHCPYDLRGPVYTHAHRPDFIEALARRWDASQPWGGLTVREVWPEAPDDLAEIVLTSGEPEEEDEDDDE